MTDYYIEYRTNFDKIKSKEWLLNLLNNKTNYGLNFSLIEKGILITLGRNNMYAYEGGITQRYLSTWTFLLTLHPNSRVCETRDDGDGVCFNESLFSSYFAMILPGETYADEFNKMRITILEANESGALVKVCNDMDCDGNNPNINPGATESCNGIDDNCNGVVDWEETENCWCEENNGVCVSVESCSNLNYYTWGNSHSGHCSIGKCCSLYPSNIR